MELQLQDLVSMNKFLKIVENTMQIGYGEAIMKVTIKNGTIKLITLTQTTTISVDERPETHD